MSKDEPANETLPLKILVVIKTVNTKEKEQFPPDCDILGSANSTI